MLSIFWVRLVEYIFFDKFMYWQIQAILGFFLAFIISGYIYKGLGLKVPKNGLKIKIWGVLCRLQRRCRHLCKIFLDLFRM